MWFVGRHKDLPNGGAPARVWWAMAPAAAFGLVSPLTFTSRLLLNTLC